MSTTTKKPKGPAGGGVGYKNVAKKAADQISLAHIDPPVFDCSAADPTNAQWKARYGVDTKVGDLLFDSNNSYAPKVCTAASGTTPTWAAVGAAASLTLQQAFANGKAITGANSSGNAVKIGDGTDDIYIFRNGANDCQITTVSGSDLTIAPADDLVLAPTGGDITVTGAMTVSSTLGVTGVTTCSGGCNVTGTLAVTGTITGTLGMSAWAANPTITLSATTGNGLTVDGTTVTTGNILYLTADASLASGNFISCYDSSIGGGSVQFSVADTGVVTVRGPGIGSGAVTLATGDLVLSDGNVDITTSSTHGGDIIDITRGNSATAGDAIDIDMGSAAVAGDAIDISWAGAGTGAALRIAMANAATTAQALVYSSNVAATVSPFSIADTGFVGATGVGLVNISSTGNLAHANASCLLIAYSGTGAASGLGTSIRVTDTGATSTSHAVYISAATGSALYVAGSGTVDTITITSAAAAASAVKATCSAATGTVYEAIAAASATASAMTFACTGTGATGWLGADGVGMIHVVGDGNLAHANASLVRIAYSGTGAATGLGTSLSVIDTGATNTSAAVYISTGASGGNALKIAASGTANDSIVVTSAATAKSALKITTSVTTGKVLELISAASATVSAMSFANSGTGATGWLGANGVGMLSVVGDGNLAHANASLVRIAYSGTGAASGLGTSLAVIDTGATNTSAAVYISTGASGGNALSIAASGTANDSVVVSSAATGKSALKVTTTATTGTAAEFVCAASTTTSMVKVDGSTGDWLGADDVGLVNITCDGALAHADASCLRIAYSGAGAATGLGTSLRIVDTGSTATSYAAYISAATGEALFVGVGKSKFTEMVSFYASNRECVVPNYVTAGGVNNAITATLIDSDGTAVPLAAGLRLFVNTGALTLQAGANTLALNGGAAKDIKSHNNVGNDIAAAYIAGSIVELVYDGTRFVDMSQ